MQYTQTIFILYLSFVNWMRSPKFIKKKKTLIIIIPLSFCLGYEMSYQTHQSIVGAHFVINYNRTLNNTTEIYW